MGEFELNSEIYRVNNRALIYDSVASRKLSYGVWRRWQGLNGRLFRRFAFR